MPARMVQCRCQRRDTGPSGLITCFAEPGSQFRQRPFKLGGCAALRGPSEQGGRRLSHRACGYAHTEGV